MPVIISCPSCGNQGDLPDDVPSGVTLTCRQCGVRFSPDAGSRVVATPPPRPDSGSGAVWVGPGPGIPLPPPPIRVPDPSPVVPLDPAPVAEIPSDVAPEDAAAHHRWLTDETRRFQTYVDRQLVVLQKMREQVAEYESKVRADAVLREQSLNRERAVLDGRVADVARRETELAAALAQQGEELTTELGRLVAAEREQLTRRADELAQAEESLQRRLAEAEELEQTVRDELDEREATVERRRRAVAEAEQNLRTRIPIKGGPAFFISPPPTPPPGKRGGA